MSEQFPFDVFLSHSSRDKSVVRETAQRLRADGLRVWFDEWEIKPGDSIPAKIEEGLERSRVLVLCMSADAFGSDWAQLEASTFRFRDPLNRERRFIPLRLDDAPIKGSLAQFLYISWRPPDREQEYPKILEACRPPEEPLGEETQPEREQVGEAVIDLRYEPTIAVYAFRLDGKYALSGSRDKDVRVWDVENERRLRKLQGHTGGVEGVAWSGDGRFALSGSVDKTMRLWEVEPGRLKRIFEGHADAVLSVAWSADQLHVLSGSRDKTIRLWLADTELCIKVFSGHTDGVESATLSKDSRFVVSGSADKTVRLWEVDTGRCMRVFEGHTDAVLSVAWSVDQKCILSASRDKSVKLWDVDSGLCLRTFVGHAAAVNCVTWAFANRSILSGSADKTVRLWEMETGLCLRVFEGHTASVESIACNEHQRRAFSGGEKGDIRVWDLSGFSELAQRTQALAAGLMPTQDQVQYTNAKVLLVGDTHAGKSGLAHRLATGEWKPSEASTVGAWATQLKLKDSHAEAGVDREVWLWDFGGQADQRLIHQLYMDRTALILLLFNADQEEVLPGLRDWQAALRRGVKEKIPHILVAGRIDAGFKASRGKLQAFAREQGLEYFETSSKTGEGCDELREAMINGVPWAQMEMRTSPHIFKVIKDEILKLRDEGQVLHTFKELRELLYRRLPDEPRFTDETLQTVIGLLDGPGVVRELDYGTYILLAPEWINAYAQAVIRTLRSAENDLGVLPLRSIAEGQLIYQRIGRDGSPVEMKRLPAAEERVVLGEMERQLEQRGLCRRQGNKLVFPSHCGRDRPAVMLHPTVFVSYAVKGFLDDIYATLVAKLADCESFQLQELWRDAADFVTLAGDYHMGLKLTRETASEGNISVYFGKGVTQEEQVIFAKYIHAHLGGTCEHAVRLRHYVCPVCHVAKGNPEVLMKKLLAKKQDADTECDGCGQRFPLWDVLEKIFASEVVRQQVEELQADDLAKLDARRKGKLLVLDVGARITSANQKWYEIPQEEDDGIDIVVEFTDDDGNGVGKGLCLQLKAGNSHLVKRKTDGVEVFTIKKPRWVQTWMRQPYPVMLVIGTFSDEDDQLIGKERVEFADVRWMEISSVLERESQNGKKPVKQIEFKGERVDMSSVRKWREKCLSMNVS
jgi:small GTP-binding protein